MLTDSRSRCALFAPAAPAGAVVQWTGSCRGGYAEGEGEYLLTNNGAVLSSTRGTFSGGKINGIGTRILGNGDLYEGEFRDGRASGRGTMLYRGTDGGAYEGEFLNDLPHGQGTRRYTNRSVYSGMWVAGARHGRGRMDYSNGAVYEGEWRNNLRHGHGHMDYGNGAVYEGGWSADQRSGQGAFQYVTAGGTFAYSGNWRADKRNGQGSEFYGSQNVRVDGSFVDDRPQGRVVYTNGGQRYEGDVNDGCLRSEMRTFRIIGTGDCW
jgi:hypothetical protein